jgi:hypothetical protein
MKGGDERGQFFNFSHFTRKVAAAHNVLAGRGQRGVKRVDVNIVVGHIAGHDRANVKMNVIQRLDQPANIIDVPQARLAGVAGFQIEHQHRRPAGAQVDALAAQMQIGLAVSAVKYYIAVSQLHTGFNQAVRKKDPVAGRVNFSPSLAQNLAAL